MTQQDKKEILTDIWKDQIEGQEKYPFAWRKTPASFISWASKKYKPGSVLVRKDANWDYRHGNLMFEQLNGPTDALDDLIEREIQAEAAKEESAKEESAKEVEKEEAAADKKDSDELPFFPSEPPTSTEGAPTEGETTIETPKPEPASVTSTVAPLISVEADDDEEVVVVMATTEPSFKLEDKDEAPEVPKVPEVPKKRGRGRPRKIKKD